MSDWNTNVINEFRANGGRVGGQFEGAPLILLHHKGRKSGADYVTPLMYQADESDPGTLYLFASKAGAPTDPEWYRNIKAAGHALLETGEGSYEADVSELEGDERDRIFAQQVDQFPGFGEYAEKTAGIRDIPVVALRRRG
jgi:deazaflavin-dependent oxidoreductase (nitroreductase family)